MELIEFPAAFEDNLRFNTYFFNLLRFYPNSSRPPLSLDEAIAAVNSNAASNDPMEELAIDPLNLLEFPDVLLRAIGSSTHLRRIYIPNMSLSRIAIPRNEGVAPVAPVTKFVALLMSASRPRLKNICVAPLETIVDDTEDLAAVLCSNPATAPYELHIRGVTSESCRVLRKCLKHSDWAVTRLSLSLGYKHNLPDADIPPLFGALGTNQFLHELTICFLNVALNETIAKMLASVLKKNTSLKHVIICTDNVLSSDTITCLAEAVEINGRVTLSHNFYPMSNECFDTISHDRFLLPIRFQSHLNSCGRANWPNQCDSRGAFLLCLEELLAGDDDELLLSTIYYFLRLNPLVWAQERKMSADAWML